MGCLLLVSHMALDRLLVELADFFFGLHGMFPVQLFRSLDFEAQQVQPVPELVDFPELIVPFGLVSRSIAQV